MNFFSARSDNLNLQSLVTKVLQIKNDRRQVSNMRDVGLDYPILDLVEAFIK